MHSFKLRPLVFCLSGMFAGLGAWAAPPGDTPAEPDATGTLSTVDVTVQKSPKAGINLSPQAGTTVYKIDSQRIDALGQGAATSFDDVLLTMPGVSKDSTGSGSIHVRDDHANVQYRVDGVVLPESISGFGQSIDTRYVQSIDFLTGALPAQYGLRTAGIVDIQTKEGGEPGGQVALVLGSHDQVQPLSLIHI